MASERFGYTVGSSVTVVGGVFVSIGASTKATEADLARNGWFIFGVALAILGLFILTITGGNHLLDVGKGVLGKRRQSTPAGPVQTHPTPGHMGFVSAGVGVVLDPESKTPRVKEMNHGPKWGGYQSGNLPVHVTSLGPSGVRDMKSTTPHDIWVWNYENVTLVNESDEHLTFHVWLVAKTTDKIGIWELKTEPDSAITLAPHETKQQTFQFRLPLMTFFEDEGLSPGEPTELQLIEDGSLGRKRVIDYRERQEK